MSDESIVKLTARVNALERWAWGGGRAETPEDAAAISSMRSIQRATQERVRHEVAAEYGPTPSAVVGPRSWWRWLFA